MEISFVDQCREAWDRTWSSVVDALEQGESVAGKLEDSELTEAIHACVNSSTKTYRYVLPTQLIAKYVDPSIDARCIQVQRGGPGAFDARTIAHKVIVPFDKENDNVLGGSPEPYVNNPLRVPEITLNPSIRDQQKNKSDWDKLYKVLNTVEEQDRPEFTATLLQHVQLEIIKRLSETRVVYPVPIRINLERTMEILAQFVAITSGGDRPEVVATALFKTIGERFNLYSEIRRSKTTAPDAATGQVADIECLDNEGLVLLAVEIKDQKLQINHITDKLSRVREQNVSELLYLVQQGIAENDVEEVEKAIMEEFPRGQNIYVFDLLDFAEHILALLGEAGRRDFLENVGEALEKYSSPPNTKRHWASLLAQV